jgi:phospholipase/carboxylesterase
MSSHDQLVIMLHGIGASGAQLMPLASSWRAGLPNTRFAVPDAPMHHRYGHQWFSTEGNPAKVMAAGNAFDRLMNDVVRREGFADANDRIAFVGVWQGAIVALDAVASGRWKVGALVAFAGLLPPQPISPASKDTPVLLVHGQADTTIPLPLRRWPQHSLEPRASMSSSMSSQASDTRFRAPAP